MLKVKDKQTISVKEAVERYDNLNEIIIGHDKKHGDIYKLSRVYSGPSDKFALVTIDGHQWANGCHKNKEDALQRFLMYSKNGSDEILVFEDEKEYAEWLVNNV